VESAAPLPGRDHRLIAQNGILHSQAGELYLQGEAAMGKISLPPPLQDREYHLFCSPFNVGALEFAKELKAAPVFVTKGKKASATLTYTTDVSNLASCDHMLVLLDDRTFTSGEDTAQFVEHIHDAMRTGVHLNCIHEFPSVVGPPRHECEFGLFFNDDWTPAHLTGGPTNLYKEIAFALKGVEWRQPGLVAVASKLAASAAPHKPIKFLTPSTYEPKTGPNPWAMDGADEKLSLGAVAPALPPSGGGGSGGGVAAPDHVDAFLVDEGSSVAPPAPPPAAAPFSTAAAEGAEEGAEALQNLSDRIKGMFSPPKVSASAPAAVPEGLKLDA